MDSGKLIRHAALEKCGTFRRIAQPEDRSNRQGCYDPLLTASDGSSHEATPPYIALQTHTHTHTHRLLLLMHKYLTTLQQHQANMSVISLAFVDSAKDKGMSASPAAFPCPLHKRKWHWNVCFPLDVDLYFFWNQHGMHDSSRWNNIWMPAKGACRCFRGADVGPSPCMALEPDSAAHRKNQPWNWPQAQPGVPRPRNGAGKVAAPFPLAPVISPKPGPR